LDELLSKEVDEVESAAGVLSFYTAAAFAAANSHNDIYQNRNHQRRHKYENWFKFNISNIN